MWYQEREEGILLFIKVIPRASKNEIVEMSDDFLKIKIKAVPEKGKANQALIKFLADFFEVPQNGVKIVKGQNQPLKIVFVPMGVDRLVEVMK